MKKITFMLFMVLSALGVQAQTDYYTVLPNNNSTSQNGRAPQGFAACGRSVWLITADEMANSGFTAGSVVNAIGFNYGVAQDIPTTGTLVVYLQNTADVANNKSVTWATAIAAMTTVSNGPVTIPDTAGTVDYDFVGGSTFTYTGGGLYVAFDYQNLSNPLATAPNTALCSNELAAGLKGAFGATPPTTVVASNFRPETRLGKAVTCAKPSNLAATNATLNSIDISYTATGGTINLEYGPFGFTQGDGSGTTVSNISNPYTLSGLDSGTVYDFYLQKDCGGGDMSTWAGPFAFNTVFPPVDPTYVESFENFTLPFVGWLAVPNDTPDGWFINQGLAQDGDFTCASIAPLTPATNDADAWMFSRGVNLIAGAQVTIDFFVENFVATGATNAANYAITLGTAQDAASQTIPVFAETDLVDIDYVARTATFTAPSTGIFYFGVHNMSPVNNVAGSTQALLFDNFSVSQVLGVNEFLSSQFSVYPNPAKNVINISNTTNAAISLVEMTDMNGRVVKSQKVSGVSGQVSIADLASGMYMMNITTDQGKAVKKIVKQ